MTVIAPHNTKDVALALVRALEKEHGEDGAQVVIDTLAALGITTTYEEVVPAIAWARIVRWYEAGLLEVEDLIDLSNVPRNVPITDRGNLLADGANEAEFQLEDWAGNLALREARR